MSRFVPLMGSCSQFCLILHPHRVAVPFPPTFSSPWRNSFVHIHGGTALLKAKFWTTKGTGIWRIVLTKKMRGHSGGKFARKSRNSWRVSGGGVGAHGQLTQGANFCSPGAKYKRSKIVFAVTTNALTFEHLWTQLTASRAVSNRESRYLPIQ